MDTAFSPVSRPPPPPLPLSAAPPSPEDPEPVAGDVGFSLAGASTVPPLSAPPGAGVAGAVSEPAHTLSLQSNAPVQSSRTMHASPLPARGAHLMLPAHTKSVALHGGAAHVCDWNKGRDRYASAHAGRWTPSAQHRARRNAPVTVKNTSVAGAQPRCARKRVVRAVQAGVARSRLRASVAGPQGRITLLIGRQGAAAGLTVYKRNVRRQLSVTTASELLTPLHGTRRSDKRTTGRRSGTWCQRSPSPGRCSFRRNRTQPHNHQRSTPHRPSPASHTRRQSQ
jgi:hypothetical protein